MGKAEVYWTSLHDVMIQYYFYSGLHIEEATSIVSMLGHLIIFLSLYFTGEIAAVSHVALTTT